jgi:hypothetical protein
MNSLKPILGRGVQARYVGHMPEDNIDSVTIATFCKPTDTTNYCSWSCQVAGLYCGSYRGMTSAILRVYQSTTAIRAKPDKRKMQRQFNISISQSHGARAPLMRRSRWQRSLALLPT